MNQLTSCDIDRSGQDPLSERCRQSQFGLSCDTG
ncbi:hypothetical protein D039_4663A, partial [Vibrio parahaemolyticus EKP-028]